MSLIKNKIISLAVVGLIIFTPAFGERTICGNLYKVPQPKPKTETEIVMGDLEEKIAKKNGNSFLYMISPDKGKVWTYLGGKPNKGKPNNLIVYTVINGEIVSEEKILYKKSINWLDSFDTNVASEVFLYNFHSKPPLFQATIDKKRKLGGPFGGYYILNDAFFPSLEQLVMFVDSFPQKSFYDNLVRRYQERTKTNDVPEGFEKPITRDPFLINLSRDICDYILPRLKLE